MKREYWILLAVAFACLAVFVFIGSATLVYLFLRSNPASQSTDTDAAKPMTRDKFKELVLTAKDRDAVIRRVGKPSSTNSSASGDTWYYDGHFANGKVSGGRTYDPVTGKEDERAIIRFDPKNPEKAKEVAFYATLIQI